MWNVSFDIIGFLIGLLAWGTIGYIAYRIYTKQSEKPRLWKIVVVIIVGLFSFSINWTMFDTVLEISILPLGVWILYVGLKGKEGRWQTYRRFAWLGFWANFIFLATALFSMPIYNAIYPDTKASTYISSVKNASIVTIHPSAIEMVLNKETVVNQLDEFERSRILNEVWYEETYINADSNKRNERFPYLLIDAKPKWGSGTHSTIYIEEDGKGILISTKDKQYYFRANSSVLKGGDQSE
ncbi:hypothetical protein [Cytobacillus luteolus]|uniref:hypothetical protein n=1 Tax=Litchfieldia luteola TaxID=682179 RepID=UPI001CB2B3AA|nr:hypothetical protein [Cytobacillus luteolus]MBP1943754.1 hypothetical protein [Cytobacillus luteolus]